MYCYVLIAAAIGGEEEDILIRGRGRPSNQSKVSSSIELLKHNDDLENGFRNVFGLFLYFGVVQLSNIKDYWSESHGIKIGIKKFTLAKSCQSPGCILRVLHQWFKKDCICRNSSIRSIDAKGVPNLTYNQEPTGNVPSVNLHFV